MGGGIRGVGGIPVSDLCRAGGRGGVLLESTIWVAVGGGGYLSQCSGADAVVFLVVDSSARQSFGMI